MDKSDGYTLVFAENEGIEIFELVVVGSRIFASTSDGVYEIKESGSHKVTLKDVMDSDPTTGSQPVFKKHDGFEGLNVVETPAAGDSVWFITPDNTRKLRIRDGAAE